MSLFGSNTQTAQSGGGLFGASTTANAAPAAGGLFGANANQNKGTSLFGSSTTQNTQAGTTGGLFGSNTNTNTNTATQPSTGGLFGSNNNANANQTQSAGGLFGSNAAAGQTGASGGLFGSSTLGTNTANTNQNSGGLFGASSNQNPAGASLFGQNTAQGTQNQPSLFGSTLNANAANKPSLFGNSTLSNPQPQAQQAQQQLGASLYNPPTVSVGAQGHLIPSASLQRLQMSGYSTVPNEKKVADQIRTLTGKWNPQDENTLLKAYLYNAVDKSFAPFYYPDARSGEDEKSWEEALNQRPTIPKVEGAEATALAFVPVLCRGFKALGERVETQAKSVLEMRNRLHEMNNSLSAVMDKHQQSITVKIENARRQHQILSQRCLHLAVKVQVLRNRGYPLDAAEEGLRRALIGLNQQVQDDRLSGREDEIWARMVALRERTRWLEEEGRRVAAQVDQQQNQTGANGQSNGIPDEVLLKTRKILKDYHGQLTHLSRELEDVNKGFTQWQNAQRR